MYTFDLLEGVTSCDTINGACKLYSEVCADHDCSHTEFCYIDNKITLPIDKE